MERVRLYERTKLEYEDIFHDKIEPYSEVNIVGKITSNLRVFEKVKRGSIVKMELV